MPTSAQSALSASARLSVDASDCDREPARDNVFPWNVDDYRCPAARSWRLHRDAPYVDGDQLAFDDRLRLAAAVADVHSLAVEALVIGVAAQRPFGSGRRDLEVVRTADQVGAIEQRPGDSADALAVLDRDGLVVVDGDPQRAPRVTGLIDRVEVVAHVVQGGLEQLFDRRYGPGWHVRCFG